MLQPSANASAIYPIQLYTRMLPLFTRMLQLCEIFSCTRMLQLCEIFSCTRMLQLYTRMPSSSAKCFIHPRMLQLSPNAPAEPSVNDSVVSCSFQLLHRSVLCLRCQTFPLPHLILFYSGLPYLSASPAAALLPPPPPSAACVCCLPSNHARKLFSGANLRRHAE